MSDSKYEGAVGSLQLLWLELLLFTCITLQEVNMYSDNCYAPCTFFECDHRQTYYYMIHSSYLLQALSGDIFDLIHYKIRALRIRRDTRRTHWRRQFSPSTNWKF